MTKRAPSLFIGHGSPMNAIEDTPAARGWAAVARRFDKPRAIVCVSAHWETGGVRVTANERPRTIHDFGRGFPQALFDVQYPAPGDPALAQSIAGLIGAQLDESWGFDHGAWSVLRRMYPDADVPIVQVGLDHTLTPRAHYDLGRKLAVLRDDNVAIIGSGNIVHNLPEFFHGDGSVGPWSTRFEAAMAEAILSGDHAAVLNYRDQPDAARAAPDWEHFAPLFYTLGAFADGEEASLFNQEMMSGISMTCVAGGLST